MTGRDFLNFLRPDRLTGFLPAILKRGRRRRPNILWIMIEDWGLDLSCYGDKTVETPEMDKLAYSGMRFDNAFTTSPVCSPSRSAMMTGFHQNYIGCHQHRTENKQPLPEGIEPIPHLLEKAGYYTVLMDQKTDCNFAPHKPLFMATKGDWNGRRAGQPFFAQITFHGTHRPWHRDEARPIDGRDVEIPQYYPDHELVRRDWANGLEQVQVVDRQVGAILRRLEEEGLADDTIVFLIGDNGRCHIRDKQFLYDGGLRVPLLMRWPGRIKQGQVSHDLVMSIDICATILKAAGVDPGYRLHGKDLLGSEVRKREYIFAARDKMDGTHDAMRMIRSRQYKLIHNLMPERAYCQFNRYKESTYPMLALMNVMNIKKELNPVQAAFMAATKPEFELYDVVADPHETVNLAQDPAHAQALGKLEVALEEWRAEIKDQGVSEEFRRGGWSAKYPTRSLEEWEDILELWKPYVFRDPGSKMEHPGVKFPRF